MALSFLQNLPDTTCRRPPSRPAPSHTPWKTLRVSHSPPATTASKGGEKEGAQIVDTGSTGNPRPLLPTWNRNSVGFLDLLGILSLLCQEELYIG